MHTLGLSSTGFVALPRLPETPQFAPVQQGNSLESLVVRTVARSVSQSVSQSHQATDRPTDHRLPLHLDARLAN